MTPKQILEGNKLIAEFMQLKRGSCKEERWYRFDNINQGQGYFTELKYNKSYNWIMPVWCKIAKMFDFDNFTISPDRVDIYISGKIKIGAGRYSNDSGTEGSLIYKYIFVDSDELIDTLFTAIVEFLKWYNKNK